MAARLARRSRARLCQARPSARAKFKFALPITAARPASKRASKQTLCLTWPVWLAGWIARDSRADSDGSANKLVELSGAKEQFGFQGDRLSRVMILPFCLLCWPIIIVIIITIITIIFITITTIISFGRLLLA